MASEIKSKRIQSGQEAWHALAAEEVLKSLQARDQGLTSEEAARRLAEVGPNQLQEA